MKKMKTKEVEVEIAGIKFKNPILTAAGPNSSSAESLLRAFRGGAGGLVTKTICPRKAVVSHPNIASIQKGNVCRGLINSETWSELPWKLWIDKELKAAKKIGLPLIASIGYSEEELTFLGPKVEKAGVDGIEFSIHYVKKDLRTLENLSKALKQEVSIPVFVKLSPNIEDVPKVSKALARWIDGFVAINSAGPVLAIDPEKGKTLLGQEFGWLSGAPIKTIGLRYVAEIAKSVSLPIIGVGGVSSGRDVAEYIMAGASAVQVCTASLLKGQDIYGKIERQFEHFLEKRGFNSAGELKGLSLHNYSQLTRKPEIGQACNGCMMCKNSCPVQAIEIISTKNGFKGQISEDCTCCGLCISLCSINAIS